ncbi:hypothetical protein EDD21DRAFT_385496 [Dissophora ornata]|nr:hypothetical protein EDD21DRAFT_385496 [Dissophora ornata]
MATTSMPSHTQLSRADVVPMDPEWIPRDGVTPLRPLVLVATTLVTSTRSRSISTSCRSRLLNSSSNSNSNSSSSHSSSKATLILQPCLPPLVLPLPVLRPLHLLQALLLRVLAMDSVWGPGPHPIPVCSILRATFCWSASVKVRVCLVMVCCRFLTALYLLPLELESNHHWSLPRKTIRMRMMTMMRKSMVRRMMTLHQV